ncbi:hypothetical protein HYR69_09375 [Candidatus Sumerlaeota bacterium]|nr:hypothetical protein [Candidatus Sumerlaeota bacterium]
MNPVSIQQVSWERMIGAVEKVRQRLLRACTALNEHHVPYAVVEENAVASWVSRVDESAVRNTQDVDLLIRREDLDRASNALESAGFSRRHVKGMDLFLDGAGAKARDAVHLVFAGEKVYPQYSFPAPHISESEQSGGFRLINLEALVRMKLTSFRDKDRMHLRDLMEVGLVDGSWMDRLPAELAGRLKMLLDHPEG